MEMGRMVFNFLYDCILIFLSFGKFICWIEEIGNLKELLLFFKISFFNVLYFIMVMKYNFGRFWVIVGVNRFVNLL